METSATEANGTVPPVGAVMGMERRASRLFPLLLLPWTTTSKSLPSSVMVVAVAPVSSFRTAPPMAAAVRPYCAAAVSLTETDTAGTLFSNEFFTWLASSSAAICVVRSLAIWARML